MFTRLDLFVLRLTSDAPPLTTPSTAHVVQYIIVKMFAKSLHSCSWSTLFALRRALQVDTMLTTQLSGLQTVHGCSGAVYPKWSAPTSSAGLLSKYLHSSPVSSGLEEFFPRTDNLIEEGEKTGKIYEAVHLHATCIIPTWLHEHALWWPCTLPFMLRCTCIMDFACITNLKGHLYM